MMSSEHKFEFKIDTIQITVVLVVLKLFGALEWSWLWVFSPIWMYFALAVALAVVFGVLAAINEWNDNNVR